jgi:TonB-linked SusC/RagA family outer membrane protein
MTVLKRNRIFIYLPKTAAMRFSFIKSRVPLCALFSVLSILASQGSHAQGRPSLVKGFVSNGSSQPVSGASVIIRNTRTNFTSGTSTDSSGTFTFTRIPSGGPYSFTFSAIGYEKQTLSGYNIKEDITLSLMIKMKDSASTIDQVVVIGYGTQKKRDLTGAVSTVSGKDFGGQAFSNTNIALQGKVPGVEFTSTSGEPGAKVQVRIRGMGTFGSSGPLYIIDGVPLNGVDINTINPNDIATVSVLKDASAAAIYGSRAANGVILITTKKGSVGAPRLSYNGYLGVQSVHRLIPMLNSTQLAALVNETDANGGFAPQAAFNDPENLKTNTDWQKAAFPSAPMQDHNVSVSGGNETARYSLSAGYLNQQGSMVFSYLKRYSVRINSQFNVGKRLLVGENLNLTRGEGLNLGYGNNLDLAYLLGASPTMRIYRATNLGGYAGPNQAETGINNRDNIIGRRAQNRHYTGNDNVLGNIYAEYTFLPGLKYRLNIGLNHGLNTGKTYIPIFQEDNRSNLTQQLSVFRNTSDEYLIENTVTYDKVIHDNFAIGLLAGYTQQNALSSTMTGSKQDFPSNDLQVIDAGTGPALLGGDDAAWALRSYLGRANITMFGKYLITATIRRDGSSRFGTENRYGNFPSFAVGWNIDRENFMKNVKPISSLKLRASWGQLGNQEIGNYESQTTISTTPQYILGAAQVIAPAAAVLTLGNPALKWETTTQTDVGIDLAVLDNKLTFSADYWLKNTEGILLRTPISAGTGIARDNGAFQNAASVQNSGFEFVATYRNGNKDFNYEVSANLATVRNKVTSLGGVPSVINDVENVYQYGTFTRTIPGAPMSSFFGYVADGIFQNQAEIDKHATQPGVAPGDMRFKDINGDGVIDANDRTTIGSPFPKFNYGFSASASYKNFDIGLSFTGVSGKQLYNAQRAYLEAMNAADGQMATTLKRWHGEGTSNSMPRAIRGSRLNSVPSTRFVDNASYGRLQNMQIGYTLPDAIVKRLHIQHLRVYINGQNLWTITKYPNYNPDTLGGSGYNDDSLNPLEIGVDTGSVPIPTVLQAGIQVTF